MIFFWREIFILTVLVILYWYAQTDIWVGIRFVRVTRNTSNLIQNRRDKIHVHFSGAYLYRCARSERCVSHTQRVCGIPHTNEFFCVWYTLNFRKSLTEIRRNKCGIMRAAVVT